MSKDTKVKMSTGLVLPGGSGEAPIPCYLALGITPLLAASLKAQLFISHCLPPLPYSHIPLIPLFRTLKTTVTGSRAWDQDILLGHYYYTLCVLQFLKQDFMEYLNFVNLQHLTKYFGDRVSVLN